MFPNHNAIQLEKMETNDNIARKKLFKIHDKWIKEQITAKHNNLHLYCSYCIPDSNMHKTPMMYI